MRRIWIDAELIETPKMILRDEAYHHAIKVSKFQIGEEFEIVSGDGVARKVAIREIRKKDAVLEVLGERKLPELKTPYVNLAVGVSKWSTFETIIEKSVELGVHTLQPIVSDFSFVRAVKEVADSRFERWQKINKASTEQCGRGRLMNLLPPQELKVFLGNLNQKPLAKGLFAYEGLATVDIRTGLKNILDNKTGESAIQLSEQNNIGEIWAIVGSEGGFSEKERDVISAAGYPPISLGNQILRVETACFTIVSIIKYQLGLF
jgi:16S rRNA (uracil1498-N3)-methyltransferase